MRLRSFHRLCLALSLLLAHGLPALSAPPRLTADGEPRRALSEEGKVLLRWEDADGGDYQDADGGDYRLESARDPEFAVPLDRYQGPDTASLITGMVEGDHFFRVRRNEAGASWSNVVTVSVDYVDAPLVITLMVVGSVMFLATVATVLAGHRRHVGGDGQPGKGDA